MEQNNKQKNIRKSHDVSGIILIIISAFFLICLLTPLLSDIGSFVKTMTLGVIGYVSYPLFSVLLLLGIIMLTGKKSALTKKQLAYTFVLAFFATLIIQTATTDVTASFDEYISSQIAMDRSSSSAGGALFGIIAYSVVAVIKPIGAYIFYGLLFVLFASLFIKDFASQAKSSQKKVKKAEDKTVRPFQKGGAAAPIKEVTDTSLFIGNIIPGTSIKSESGDFGSMCSPLGDLERSRYSSVDSDLEYKSEESSREKARKILFGDKENTLRTYRENVSGAMKISEVHRSGGRYNGVIDDSAVIPSAVSYGVSSQESRPDLPDVPVPPQKDISSKFVKREIYNAEEISKELSGTNNEIASEDVSASVTENEKQQIYQKNKTIYAYEPAGESSVNDAAEPSTVVTMPCIKDAEEHIDSTTKSDDAENVASVRTERKCTIFDAENEINKEVDAIEIDREPSNSTDRFLEDYEIIQRREQISEERPIEPNDKENVVDDADYSIIEPKQIISDDLPNVTNDGNVDSDNVPSEDEIATAESQPSHNTVEVREIERSESEEQIDDVMSDSNVPDSQDELKDSEDYSSDAQPDIQEENISLEGKRIVCGDEPEEDCEQSKNIEAVEENDGEADSKDESDAYIASKIPSSLKLAADIDMTENRGEVNDDNTGYYTTEDTFERNVSKLSLAVDGGMSKKDTQIKMEDYSLKEEKSSEENRPKPQKKKKLRYSPPSTQLLNEPVVDESEKDIDYTQQTESLEQILSDLKVPAKVTNIVRGPAVTRFELEMPSGLSVKRITSCQEDIAYALAARGNIRIEAPIRGKRAVGVEVPNESVSIVTMREILESNEFKSASSPLTIALGKDIAGDIVLCN